MTKTGIALFMFFTAAASGQTAKLVVAGADGWTTTVTAWNQTTSPVILPLTDCRSGPTVELHVGPDAQALARNIAPNFCALRGRFGLLDAPDAGRLETQLQYRGGPGPASFYVIPALRVKLAKKNDSARVPMVVNDEVEQSWAVVFGDPGPVTFEIYNENGALVHTEVASGEDFISGWKMLVHPLQQPVAIGTLVITEGDKTRPALPVEDETYYGFVVVGARDGTANHVRVWE